MAQSPLGSSLIGRSRTVRPRLLRLEDRLAPAIVDWTGGITGNGTDWLSAGNWVVRFSNPPVHVVPGPGDDAVITGGGTQIELNASTSVRSVDLQRNVRISNGSLSVAAVPSSVGLTLTTLILDGGTFDPASGATIAGQISGPTPFTVPAGRTLNIQDLRLNNRLVNDGTIIARGRTSLFGGVTTAVGSTIRIQGDATLGAALFEDVSGFINNGTIQLTSNSAGSGATLSLTSGVLTNAVGATFDIAAGSGGDRRLDISNAGFVNQGTFTVGANTFFRQTGVSQFTTSGALTVNAGATLALDGVGGFSNVNYQGGTIGGGGAATINALVVNIAAGQTLTNGPVSIATLPGTFTVNINGAGTLANAAGATLNLANTNVNVPFTSAGTVVVRGNVTVSGGLSAAAGSTTRVLGDTAIGAALLTINGGGMTNAGLLELTGGGAGPVSATVGGSSTITNAVGGTIRATAGTGGARSFGGTGLNLVNRGTLDAATNFDITPFGTRVVSSGPIAVAPGVTLTIASAVGGLTYQGGTLSGGGTLVVGGATTTIASGASLTNGPVTLVLSGRIDGPGTVVNPAGTTLNVSGATINAPLTNAGTLAFRGNNTVNGGLLTAAGSTTRVLADGAAANLTVNTGGVTNNGTFELSSTGVANAATLTVNSSFRNAVGGTFNVLAGAGGARTLSASLFDNAGTLNVTGTNLNVDGFAGTFVNSGTLTIAPGFTVAVFGSFGAFDYRGGAVTGGTLSLSTRVDLAAGTTLTNGPALALVLANATVNGPGTLANAAGATLASTGNAVNAPLFNAGTLNFRGNNTVMGGLLTAAGSTTRVLADGGAANLTVTSGGVTNNGIFELSSTGVANAATLTVNGSATVLNAAGGTFNVLAGAGGTRTLSIASGVTTFLNAGAFNVIDADLTVASSFATFANRGTLTVGTGRTLASNSTLANTGTVAGAGTLTFPAGGGIIGGSVAPGVAGPGRLTVTGIANLIGGLIAELNGTVAGTQYDQLLVNGAVTLSGPLALNVGFAAAVGQTFTVIDNDGGDTVTGTFLGLPQGATLSANGQPFSVSYVGGSGNDVVLTRLAGAAPPVPRAPETQINDGAAQRSRITSLIVNFDGLATFASSPEAAFSLTRGIDGAAVTFAATLDTVDGQTVVTLSDFTGTATEFGSLADGRYMLRAVANRIAVNGLALDGNGDGIGGDDYSMGDAQGLFRLFGDVNGDRRVDIADFGLFAGTFQRPAGYVSSFDFDGDGRIDIADFGQFTQRYMKSFR